MVLLHGILDVNIQRATNLRNTDVNFFNKNIKSDPYVVVTLISENKQKSDIATTSVIENNLNPEWNQRYVVEVCHDVSKIQFTIYDKDILKSTLLGYCVLPPEELIVDEGFSGPLELIDQKKGNDNATLFLFISYIEKSSIPNKDSYEVPSCPFPLRHNNQLVLYQDAHCPSLPLQVKKQDESIYVPRSAWRDMHTAITQATCIIYIVGWSVSVNTKLLRNEGDDRRTLGEILKQKSNAGVKVKLLLWDELSSNSTKKIGCMNTEDNKTKDFFEGTSVEVALQYIQVKDDKSYEFGKYLSAAFKGCTFSHHQKNVITDAPINTDSNQRKLIAFIGGLDITNGRYDTSEHPLFRTLVNEHKDDFRNRMLPTLTSKSGPRQPWHDIHSRVEGPAARDILKNFEERWTKLKKEHLQTDKNLNLNYVSQNLDSWNIQMFRSINEHSVDFDSYSPQIGFIQSLPSTKLKRGSKVDDSLYRAYLHHIRRSQHFIYIENQYFMGSRHMWLDSMDGKAGNLIPLEIAIKIEEKIMKDESYVVYIVIPMFPEGQPASAPMQELLYKQKQTMQMMYSRISKAIKNSSRPNAHPQDYLMFFCLGSREPSSAKPHSLVIPEQDENAKAFHNRRNMIYVHSKMVIFDDEYIIVGSANINDRSMTGNRDTEIAIGAYQPNHLANGDISTFRKALWAEHLGINTPTDVWDHPGSLQCSQKVRELGEKALRAYIADGEHVTPHHLMVYPLTISQEGKVNARADCECIPDTNGKFVGSLSRLPKMITA